jgi:phosphinothricin acetyltransferase
MNIITQEAKKKQAVVKSGQCFVLSFDMLYVIIIRQLLSERQMFMITVGNAELKDAERLLEIYDYYVKNTAITFEYTTPTIEEFRGRMEKTMQKYPYLVAVKDEKIAGYAYAGAFVGRAAYDWSCETSIYLDKNARRCGIGKTLYAALEKELKKMGILNMYACIGYPDNEDEYLTKNSAEFHSHIGFTQVGEFHKCGYKFGRWYNMIWMEKIIGEHKKDQAPVIGFKGAL